MSSAPVGSAPPTRHDGAQVAVEGPGGAVLGPGGAAVGGGVDGAAVLLDDRAGVVVGAGEQVEAEVVAVGVGQRLPGALGRALVVAQAS